MFNMLRFNLSMLNMFNEIVHSYRYFFFMNMMNRGGLKGK